MSTPEDGLVTQAHIDRAERAALADLMRVRRDELAAARTAFTTAQTAWITVMQDLMTLEQQMTRDGTMHEDDMSAWGGMWKREADRLPRGPQ